MLQLNLQPKFYHGQKSSIKVNPQKELVYVESETANGTIKNTYGYKQVFKVEDTLLVVIKHSLYALVPFVEYYEGELNSLFCGVIFAARHGSVIFHDGEYFRLANYDLVA